MGRCEYLDHRDRARRAIRRLKDRSDVLGVDLLTPDADPTNRWTVELAIDADAVPPAVLAILADEGLSIRETGPRADWQTVVAVV
jgi:hypothetical protein